ncbi:MAG: SpoIIE family protein phosphatase [Synergistaceae bacterium]|nr:SpoIIE family protein phosphatase [Synergistaceae bacterium]
MKIRLRHNIAFEILAGVVIVLAALTLTVSVIGYYEFTGAIQSQYANSAYNTARTASSLLNKAFVSSTNYTSTNWQRQFNRLKLEWNRLATTQDATYIYLFKASGDKHEEVTFLVNVANPKFTRIGAYSPGHSFTQTDPVYLKAFSEIYDKRSNRAEFASYRPENEYQSGNHVTVFVPIYSIREGFGDIIGVIGVERRMEDLDSARFAYLYGTLRAAVILLLVVLIIYGLYLNRNLLAPIQKIAKEATRFARKNTLPEETLHAEIKTRNEIGQLARTIDVMEKDIISYVENLTRVTQEKEQIKAELNVATQIQADMLPKDFPERKEFELYAAMKPAKEVGGDFYDFFMIDNNHIALVMADVSGKGVPAALFMVIAKTLIKDRAKMGGSPSEILSDVNNQLCEGNEADLFVTVWLGILEISTGKIIASNAGHEYPAVNKNGADYELVKTKQSPAVATMEGIKFRQYEFDLHPGENLYIYTDGVAEATNIHEELYGTDRMLAALNETKNFNANEILTHMKKSVDDFTGEAPQFDDITMLCLRYFGGDQT